MEKLESLIKGLPDADGARRFYKQLAEKFPAEARKLEKNEGLLSDILTIAAFSPFLSSTLLQNPNYISWLSRQRVSAKVRGKDEILESLARFALTNSQIEPNILLARFRRRELLRIYLRDIRSLSTIAEITEEISNLADAVLEYALRLARQELDNRYGAPLEIDEKGRAKEAKFCIVALGKLGSKELNYASDIDLLFLYSSEGSTSGQGSRGKASNREYFVKLSENIVKLVAAQTGEGSAYRVDMRLRPHGRVGALAISLAEAVGYYKNLARSWEKQVLIRSRAAAGDAGIFRKFFDSVENSVFSQSETVKDALENVRLSKEKINLEKISKSGFDVKLGRGGIREIEFIAQALQLAYGGRDKWLRTSHTLISIARLGDRDLLSETELTELSDAYAFLRRLEHRLQMENGLQTHLVPENNEKRSLVAERLNCKDLAEFDQELKRHSGNVSRIFSRVFGKIENVGAGLVPAQSAERLKELSDIRRFGQAQDLPLQISPRLAGMFTANPDLIDPENDFEEKDYLAILLAAVKKESGFARRIAALRKTWSRLLLEIAVFDVFEKLPLEKVKKAQTRLAEASIETAIFITKSELEKYFLTKIGELPFAVLGLGKLGGGSLDYESDLDLILIYDDARSLPVENLTHAEFYSRAVEIFVNALSSFTRDGHLYRVDLRLRPDGKNGATSSGKTAFLNYLKTRAAIWEWLALVKLRAAGGDSGLAQSVENEARKIIYRNAQKVDKIELKEETLRIRERLEEERSRPRKGKQIDIKFGAGGMLDVYFAARFLQLRENLQKETENRSTIFTLEKLREKGVLNETDFQNFLSGYRFLDELDHNLRLVVGRSTRLPLANKTSLGLIAKRMKLSSVADLTEKLTFHRLNIRKSFESVFIN
jgi:glutamate-ammonia-ligase adenylyltransferase